MDSFGDITSRFEIHHLFVDDEKQKNHKIYLLSNDNSSINLPTWKSDGFRKTIDRLLPPAFQGFYEI